MLAGVPLSLYTLWKIKVQWRKVHQRCEERMYAPGGEGHKRARVDFEALRGGDGSMLARGLAIRGFNILDNLAARAEALGGGHEGSQGSQA